MSQYPSNPSIPAGRHDEEMRELHHIEAELTALRHDVKDLQESVTHVSGWMENDTTKSRWYYDNRLELQHLVESAKWIRTLKKAIAWVVGATAGIVMAAQQFEIWWREHIK